MDFKEYVLRWSETGKLLDALRDEELRHAPHPSVAIHALADAYLHAIRVQPPGDTSGLVEFQRLMTKWRTHDAAL